MMSAESTQLSRRMKGRKDGEQINQVATFGGSALSGAGYNNILKLSDSYAQ
jgi:hypothetical protein